MSELTRRQIGNCAVLTLNRPDSLNAITSSMLDALEEHLDAIETDQSRALILTGAGRAFCSGSDLKEPISEPGKRIQQVHRISFRLAEFPKLTIAAINGAALGGGLELAMACKFRIAVKGAKLGLPEIKIGLMPAYGGTVLLPRLIGASRAEEMMLRGEPLSVDTALAIGLVNKVCETTEDVVQISHNFLQPMCTHSLIPQQAICKAIREGQNLNLAQGLAYEADIAERVSNSDDCKEGVASFIEKRIPKWKDS